MGFFDREWGFEGGRARARDQWGTWQWGILTVSEVFTVGYSVTCSVSGVFSVGCLGAWWGISGGVFDTTVGFSSRSS